MNNPQNRVPHTADLQSGADERLLADKLVELAHRLRGSAGFTPASRADAKAGGAPAISTLVATAERELRHRRLRLKFLPRDLFAEGAWAMLLDLFTAQHNGRKISTTSACLAADIPATSALRWLDVLEQHHLISRAPDKADRRVKYVALTEVGHKAVCSILASYD